MPHVDVATDWPVLSFQPDELSRRVSYDCTKIIFSESMVKIKFIIMIENLNQGIPESK